MEYSYIVRTNKNVSGVFTVFKKGTVMDTEDNKKV